MTFNLRSASKAALTVLLATGSFFASAQTDNVGIGTSTPHPNAILDVSSSSKGFLAPRLNTLQRTLMNPLATAQGLLVYDTDLSEFCYWDGALWVCYPASGFGGGGATGPTGPAGVAGPAGANGPAGPTGPVGVAGPAGPAGPVGSAGPIGPNGANGPAGAPGNGIVNTIDNGDGTLTFFYTDGTTFISPNLIGPAGPAGPAGAAGAAGPAGAPGAAGAAGPAGPAGPAGAAGTNGTNGPAGAPGAAGPAGANGAPGATGPAGPTGPSAANNSLTVNLASLTALTQTGSGTITYLNLPNLTYTFTVPTGETWHVYSSAFGTALNLGSFNDCTAQFQIFENGVGTGKLQRAYIADFSTELTFAYDTWSIAYANSYPAGTYTLDVRGAHSGPTGGTNIQLAGATGGFQSHFELLIVRP